MACLRGNVRSSDAPATATCGRIDRRKPRADCATTRKLACWFHTCRAAGRDRDHRHSGGATAAGNPGGAGSGATERVCEQAAATGNCAAEPSRRQARVSFWRGNDGGYWNSGQTSLSTWAVEVLPYVEDKSLRGLYNPNLGGGTGARSRWEPLSTRNSERRLSRSINVPATCNRNFDPPQRPGFVLVADAKDRHYIVPVRIVRNAGRTTGQASHGTWEKSFDRANSVGVDHCMAYLRKGHTVYPLPQRSKHRSASSKCVQNQ